MQRIKAETKTASGIFLPESAVKELNEAKVLAVGPGGLDKDGKRVACGVKAGDRVLIPQVGLIFLWVFRTDWDWILEGWGKDGFSRFMRELPGGIGMWTFTASWCWRRNLETTGWL